MIDLTSAYFPQYKIGRWTYGKPEILFYDLGANLVIGSFSSIAPGAKIFLGGEHKVDRVTTYPFDLLWEQAVPYKDYAYTRGDVVIGSDVWLGSDSLVLSGVTIGDGAVVGARAVVGQSVPPYAIVSGNPAKVLRYRFNQETIAALLEIAWWNWDDDKIIEYLPDLLSPDIRSFLKKARSGASSPSPLT